jgi:hypothetical protein
MNVSDMTCDEVNRAIDVLDKRTLHAHKTLEDGTMTLQPCERTDCGAPPRDYCGKWEHAGPLLGYCFSYSLGCSPEDSRHYANLALGLFRKGEAWGATPTEAIARAYLAARRSAE